MKRMPALMLPLAAALAAGAAAAAGAEHFTLTARTVNGKDGALRVLARGVINDSGTFRISDRQRTSSGVFRLAKGNLDIAFVHGKLTFRPNPAACRVTIDDRGGTFAIRGGTGPYVHATGKGSYVEQRLMVGRRNAAGRCLLGPHSKVPPALSTSIDHLVGKVALGTP